MPDQESQNLQQFGLTLAEIAILEATNQPTIKLRDIRAKKRGRFLLTTKEFYLWAVLMSIAVERKTDPEYFVAIIHDSISLTSRLLTEKLTFLDSPFNAERILEAASSLFKVSRSELVELSNRAYLSLLEKGLIEDPIDIIIGGIAVAVLGSIPITWTKKTRDGKLISKKINALWWSYQKSTSRGQEETQLSFNLLKLMRTFYSVVPELFKDALEVDTRSRTSLKTKSKQN